MKSVTADGEGSLSLKPVQCKLQHTTSRSMYLQACAMQAAARHLTIPVLANLCNASCSTPPHDRCPCKSVQCKLQHATSRSLSLQTCAMQAVARHLTIAVLANLCNASCSTPPHDRCPCKPVQCKLQHATSRSLYLQACAKQAPTRHLTIAVLASLCNASCNTPPHDRCTCKPAIQAAARHLTVSVIPTPT